MNKIIEYYEKVVAWVQANPGKTTLIGIFAAGLLIGAILF
jgi:hypothetical protein